MNFEMKSSQVQQMVKNVEKPSIICYNAICGNVLLSRKAPVNS